MTHRERAVMALTLQQPDYVPTFELEYQLADKVFGKDFLTEEQLKGLSPKETEKAVKENAEYMVHVYSELGYSILPLHYLSEEHMKETARYINRMTNNEFLLTAHGDGTFAIPDGDGMLDFVYRIADDPDGVKEEARKMADSAIEHNKRLREAGIDSFILCSDYCFNNGPFLSPAMFEEFIQPYLAEIIAAIRADGAYAIKHTDGNIMPILDQLVECRPHALHSLDPMAGVDIKEVKARVGNQVALCGNVHCAHLQTGTDEEVLESCRYAMENGKPGGGYIFCTSNVPFRGMPVERYQMVLDFWRANRNY
ncbi:MAG TPA: hypothetical protein IAB22_00375 [Candidatus Merdivicinus intestinavium]|nr:hypothetical protein [Candidatus Merdivicinus intestinavium]